MSRSGTMYLYREKGDSFGQSTVSRQLEEPAHKVRHTWCKLRGTRWNDLEWRRRRLGGSRDLETPEQRQEAKGQESGKGNRPACLKVAGIRGHFYQFEARPVSRCLSHGEKTTTCVYLKKREKRKEKRGARGDDRKESHRTVRL
jgi:hypothetical protein